MTPKRPPLKASFLSPEARAEPIATTAACPDCKSTDVMFLLHPNTCELVQMLDHTMMKCGGCGGQFAADYVAALAALAAPGARNPSATISEDLVCPECRSCIQGQRAGKPCRGCGNVIPEHMAMSLRWVRKNSASTGLWLIGLLVVCAGGYAAYLNRETSRGLGIVFLLVAAYELLNGIRGLVTGKAKFTQKWFAPEFTGWKAKAISILHLVVGVAIVVVGIVMIARNTPFDRGFLR